MGRTVIYEDDVQLAARDLVSEQGHETRSSEPLNVPNQAESGLRTRLDALHSTPYAFQSLPI